MGTHSSIDFEDEKRQVEGSIAGYVPQEYPCAYNPGTGSTDCFLDCVSYHVDWAECPECTFYRAQRQLLRYPMLQFFKLAFYHPRFAEGNGLFEDKHLIKSHQ